jgi:hypothetical protein
MPAKTREELNPHERTEDSRCDIKQIIAAFNDLSRRVAALENRLNSGEVTREVGADLARGLRHSLHLSSI